jgi:hypothetical protein
MTWTDQVDRTGPQANDPIEVLSQRSGPGRDGDTPEAENRIACEADCAEEEHQMIGSVAARLTGFELSDSVTIGELDI